MYVCVYQILHFTPCNSVISLMMEFRLIYAKSAQRLGWYCSWIAREYALHKENAKQFFWSSAS